MPPSGPFLIAPDASRSEIKEILLQIGAYCGIPACLEAFRIATEVFKEADGAKTGD